MEKYVSTSWGSGDGNVQKQQLDYGVTENLDDLPEAIIVVPATSIWCTAGKINGSPLAFTVAIELCRYMRGVALSSTKRNINTTTLLVYACCFLLLGRF